MKLIKLIFSLIVSQEDNNMYIYRIRKDREMMYQRELTEHKRVVKTASIIQARDGQDQGGRGN